MSFSLQPNTARFESPLNRSMQTSELPGARWNAVFGWQNLSDADARIMKAWLNSLSGMAGRFYLYDATHPTPSGTAAGTPIVNGASQSGRTLVTDGWTANQSSLLLPGDYIGVNGQLLVITAAAASNALGQATLSIEPPLRTSPADNAAITVTRPTCTMMLTDDQQDRFDFQQKGFVNLKIECMEIF
jgi:hypothetical protein